MTVTVLPFEADSQVNHIGDKQQQLVKACKQQTVCISSSCVTSGFSLLMTVTGLLLFSKLPFDADSKANTHCRQTQQRHSDHTTDCVHQQQLCHLRLLLADDCHRAV